MLLKNLPAEYLTEIQLSRTFASYFEQYLEQCLDNQKPLPTSLVKAYKTLRQHYQLEQETGVQ